MDRPRLQLHVRGDNAGTTLAVTGEIDMATAPELEAEARRLLDAEVEALTLDLTEVEFCDSQGVGAMMRVLHEAQERGAQLTVTNPQPMVDRVLQILGVDKTLGVRRDPIG